MFCAPKLSVALMPMFVGSPAVTVMVSPEFSTSSTPLISKSVVNVGIVVSPAVPPDDAEPPTEYGDSDVTVQVIMSFVVSTVQSSSVIHSPPV